MTVKSTRSTQYERDTFGPKVVDALYELLGVNVTHKDINYKVVSQTIGLPEGGVLHIVQDLENAGVLVRSYKRMPGDPMYGKTARWTLTVPKDEGLTKLHAFWKANAAPGWRDELKNGKGAVPIAATIAAEPVAIATSAKEETRAIAGPDAAKPFDALRSERKDEAAALIEAARQYGDRQNVIRRAFQEMEKQGIKVEWDKVDTAVHVDPDERLDIISQVLPHITTLEKRVERLAADNAELRERLKGYDTLRSENNKLREQNQRLLAQRAVQA